MLPLLYKILTVECLPNDAAPLKVLCHEGTMQQGHHAVGGVLFLLSGDTQHATSVAHHPGFSGICRTVTDTSALYVTSIPDS